MAYFAEIDDKSVVARVLVVKDSVPNGASFLSNLFGGEWVQCSRNNTKKMAVSGSIYHTEDDGFQFPSPFPSWSWNKESWQWEPPTPRPSSSDSYGWNEENQSWDKIL